MLLMSYYFLMANFTTTIGLFLVVIFEWNKFMVIFCCKTVCSVKMTGKVSPMQHACHASVAAQYQSCSLALLMRRSKSNKQCCCCVVNRKVFSPDCHENSRSVTKVPRAIASRCFGRMN
jgi:hypothetical protein